VFSDKTLRAMAEGRPSTPEELLAVSGVGPLKLERYGQAFLEAVGTAGP
jgi:superfamily II DNA helicase RecQ